jgi:hypothetical protein
MRQGGRNDILTPEASHPFPWIPDQVGNDRLEGDSHFHGNDGIFNAVGRIWETMTKSLSFPRKRESILCCLIDLSSSFGRISIRPYIMRSTVIPAKAGIHALHIEVNRAVRFLYQAETLRWNKIS